MNRRAFFSLLASASAAFFARLFPGKPLIRRHAFTDEQISTMLPSIDSVLAKSLESSARAEVLIFETTPNGSYGFYRKMYKRVPWDDGAEWENI